VLAHAVALLRAAQLDDAYDEAWTTWDTSGEAAIWESTSSDGLSDGSEQ